MLTEFSAEPVKNHSFRTVAFQGIHLYFNYGNIQNLKQSISAIDTSRFRKYGTFCLCHWSFWLCYLKVWNSDKLEYCSTALTIRFECHCRKQSKRVRHYGYILSYKLAKGSTFLFLFYLEKLKPQWWFGTYTGIQRNGVKKDSGIELGKYEKRLFYRHALKAGIVNFVYSRLEEVSLQTPCFIKSKYKNFTTHYTCV